MKDHMFQFKESIGIMASLYIWSKGTPWVAFKALAPSVPPPPFLPHFSLPRSWGLTGLRTYLLLLVTLQPSLSPCRECPPPFPLLTLDLQVPAPTPPNTGSTWAEVPSTTRALLWALSFPVSVCPAGCWPGPCIQQFFSPANTDTRYASSALFSFIFKWINEGTRSHLVISTSWVNI